MSDPSRPPRQPPEVASVLVVLAILTVVGLALFGITKLLPDPAVDASPAATSSTSPTPSEAIASPETQRAPDPARAIAARWAELYSTYHWRDRPQQRLARLRPLSSPKLLKSLGRNSGALALREAQWRARERAQGFAEGVQTLEGRRGHAVMVIVRQVTHSKAGRDVTYVTVGLELERQRGRWVVTQVVPQ